MKRKSKEYRFLQSRAVGAVAGAVERGSLPNLSKTEVACIDCGKRATQYDHRDYGKPLEVSPVCQSCNRKRGPAAHDPLTAYSDKYVKSFRKFNPGVMFNMRIPRRMKRKWKKAARERGMTLTGLLTVAMNKAMQKELNGANPAVGPARSRASA